MSKRVSNLPPEQEAIRARCFHPTGTFAGFTKEEIEQSIPERFEKIAQRYPDRIAVKESNRLVTYAELNKAANRLARAILARRSDGNEPVGIFLEFGAPLIIAILGILKAGNIFVIIDPSFPEERINYLLADSQASLVVGNATTLRLARSYLHKETDLLDQDELDATSTSDEPDLRASPDSLATLVYTSGSTGRPKGVMQNHRNLLHTVLRDVEAVNFSPSDRLALLRWNSTSGAIVDLLDGLLNGAAVYPYSILKDGFVRLSAWLIHEEITIFNSVASTFRQFLSVLSGEYFPRLRLIYIGGEPVNRNDVELYKTHFPDRCILVVRMGCSEAGKVCQYMIDKNSTIQGNNVPVGYAHDDLKIVLLDESGKPVGPGEAGEIAVMSRFLSPGYWRMPEMTKARFLPDPSGQDERVYLSGDLGRMTTEGCLFHLGRKDLQVKIRGYRVEVAEVERVLIQHPGVKEAVVVCQEDHFSQPRLVAYWVPREWPGPTVSELRRWFRQEVPDYMIPSVFTMLEAIPLLPTGKLDRGGLPSPDDSRPNLDHLYVAPTAPIEKELARIWAEVLRINKVGIDDAFSDLGGDSLQATQIISRIIMAFQVELPIRFLLTSPTIAEMASVIMAHQGKTLGDKELTRILSELESLSAEDARQLLAGQASDEHEGN